MITGTRCRQASQPSLDATISLCIASNCYAIYE